MSGGGKASTVAPPVAKVGPATTTTTAVAGVGGGAKEQSGLGARTAGSLSRPTTTRPDSRSRSSADAPVPEWKIRCLCADRGAVSAVVIGGLGCF